VASNTWAALGNGTPVSILQVATRTQVFVLDLFALAPADSPACEAFDAFLHDMLGSDTAGSARYYTPRRSTHYGTSFLRVEWHHMTWREICMPGPATRCTSWGLGSRQGLTLVHHSAQRKHILWDTLGA